VLESFENAVANLHSGEAGQPIFRAMKAEADALPEVGRSGRTLGVRIDGPSRDLAVGQDGTVEPGKGAMSVALDAAVSNWSTVSYAMDIGNSADSGQFILGEPLNERNRRSRLRLRSAWELFPEIVDPSLDDDGQPSCSAAAALEAQEPFINATLAQHAMALLARLFRYGEISYHGGFINLATGATSVMRIDPQYWKRARRIGRRSSRSIEK